MKDAVPSMEMQTGSFTTTMMQTVSFISQTEDKIATLIGSFLRAPVGGTVLGADHPFTQTHYRGGIVWYQAVA